MYQALQQLDEFGRSAGKAAVYRETSAHCLQTSGARLLRECLCGLASVSPDNLIDHQVELMRVVLEACPAAASNWLLEMVEHPEDLVMGSVDPRGETMRTFARLALQQPALQQGEFQCLASDFSRICRGKLGVEALHRYVKGTAARATAVAS